MKQYTDLDSREQDLWCELTNFIEWYASEEEDRQPLREGILHYIEEKIYKENEMETMNKKGE